PTHTYASPGYYQICLTVTDSKGCSNTFCDTTRRIAANSMIGKIVVVDVTTSVKDNPVIINSIYPNPASDVLHITLNGSVSGEVRFIDITGREVLKEKINSDHVSINTSNMPTGLYDVSVVSGNQISHSRVCIKK
ncbi:MAG TPA: T9SS type A sorting domain-containing protein, partial [Bacteroidia bacterium]|nr:T9SS type A sorting domain-containing protein [Bacteroidia bacterium]